jgi:sec-independent protein translocase protein TatA
MGAIRPWHIAVLVVLLILLFGAKRLPDAARSIGRSMRILKAETRSLSEDDAPQRADSPATPRPLDSQASATPVVDPVDRVHDN